MNSQLITLLREADHIAILTGAGVSAESGVPTFRDALTGYWSNFNPEELATPEAFARNPEMVSRWYDERRCSVMNCSPNAGHIALARLERIMAQSGRRLTLITQNVDRLHQGTGSKNIIELHGSLWVWRCINCAVETEERGPAFTVLPPGCSCGGVKRPGVVWFGETLPPDGLLKAVQAAESCKLFMTLGTSSVVFPAAGLIDQALRSGAKVLEINPQQTAYSGRVNWSIRGKTGEILPSMLAEAFGEKEDRTAK